jgi:hypothetical protein
MKACELAELSGWMAASGADFVRGRGRLSESGLRQYWVLSKQRYDRWMRALGTEHSGGRDAPVPRFRSLDSVAPVVEEILVSELLTRVWTALACQYARRHDATCVVSVVRSVLLSHQAARRRALQLMCEAHEPEDPTWTALDKLRRRAEHWTDLLLAHLVREGEADPGDLAFDAEQMREFAADLSDLKRTRHGEQAWDVFQATLRAAFVTNSPRSPNEALNAQLAASILACFPPELFEATGPLQALWQERLQHTTADTVALVEDLLAAAR